MMECSLKRFMTLKVFVLDWVCNLDEEVEVMERTGLNIPIVVYHVSR